MLAALPQWFVGDRPPLERDNICINATLHIFSSYFRGKSIAAAGVSETNTCTSEKMHSQQGNNLVKTEEDRRQDTSERCSVYDLLPPNEGGPPSYTNIETDKV